MPLFPLDYSVSAHERNILKHFGEENTVSKKQASECEKLDSVFICFTNRCGSNYLAEVIESTNYFPGSGEFFNWDTVVNNSERNNLKSLDDYCLKIINERAKNNIFISKVGYLQLLMLSKFGQIPSIFNEPKFIWIKRNDVVSQAVSMVIADQTKKWTSYQKPSECITPEYKMDGIMRTIQNIVKANTMFETYFRLFDVDYLEIVYEEFCEQPAEYMSDISCFLQKDVKTPKIEKVRTKVQRNSVNEEFKERFILDLKKSFSTKSFDDKENELIDLAS